MTTESISTEIIPQRMKSKEIEGSLNPKSTREEIGKTTSGSSSSSGESGSEGSSEKDVAAAAENVYEVISESIEWDSEGPAPKIEGNLFESIDTTIGNGFHVKEGHPSPEKSTIESIWTERAGPVKSIRYDSGGNLFESMDISNGNGFHVKEGHPSPEKATKVEAPKETILEKKQKSPFEPKFEKLLRSTILFLEPEDGYDHEALQGLKEAGLTKWERFQMTSVEILKNLSRDDGQGGRVNVSLHYTHTLSAFLQMITEAMEIDFEAADSMDYYTPQAVKKYMISLRRKSQVKLAPNLQKGVSFNNRNRISILKKGQYSTQQSMDCVMEDSEANFRLTPLATKVISDESIRLETFDESHSSIESIEADEESFTRGENRRMVSFGQVGYSRGARAYARMDSKNEQSLTLSYAHMSGENTFNASSSSNESSTDLFPIGTERPKLNPELVIKEDEEYRDKVKLNQSLGFRTNFAKTREPTFRRILGIKPDESAMKFERIEAYFYNHGMEIALGVLYLSLNLILGAHGAYQFTEAGGTPIENDILRVTLPIARAGGRLVTLNSAILLLTACKYLWTLVRTYVAPIIPIGFPIDEVMPKYHRVVALTIIFNGCIIHTLPQIVNYASRAIPMTQSGMRMWTFGDGFATKQLCLTGSLLAIIFTTFFLTTLKSFRRTTAGFRWFWFLHIGGIAFAYPLLLIHGTFKGYPILLYFALVPLLLYILDASMRRKHVYYAQVLRWRVHDGDGQQITELVLDCPNGFEYTPGQYAEIQFIPISTREWHPFTIASSPKKAEDNSNEVVFYIKNAGRWTEALMNYASAYDLTKAKKPTHVLLRGPHGAPAMNYGEYKHIVVIGSGVGVTPLLSIWRFLVEQAKYQVVSGRQKSFSNKSYRNLDQSMSVFQESMNVFGDKRHSQRFLMNFSRSIDFFDSASLDVGSSSLLDFSLSEDKKGKDTEEAFGKTRLKYITMAKFLESMTVSLPLFVTFVLGGTAIIIVQLCQWYLAANIIAAALSIIALFVHIGIVVVWTIAASWSIYFRLMKCWLDCAIIIANGFALYFSVEGCMKATGIMDAATDTKASHISIGFVIALQAVRIFHIFYVTLKAPTIGISDKPNSEQQQSKKLKRGSILVSDGISDEVEFCSVEGIIINRKFSNMKFAAKALLPQIVREGLSDVFSLYFYGTREKQEEDDEENAARDQKLVTEMMGSMAAGIDLKRSIYYSTATETQYDDFFYSGRPQWNVILMRAISRAYATNEEGETVGVFFCGSPAIAKALQTEAKRVTAQHQYAIYQLYGERSKCKIVVHSENF